MKKKETRFKEKVQADLKSLSNIWFFKSDERAVRGILDVIMCLNSFFVALELKADEDTPAKNHEVLQEYNANKIRTKAKGLAFKVTPATWPSIFKVLQGIDRMPSLASQIQLCASLPPSP